MWIWRFKKIETGDARDGILRPRTEAQTTSQLRHEKQNMMNGLRIEPRDGEHDVGVGGQ
jgi:hypothetical protein